MFQSTYDILAEACKGERCTNVTISADEMKAAYQMFADLDELDVEIGILPHMVPVIKDNFTNLCYVFAQDVSRVAEAMETEDLYDAVSAIAESNDLELSELAVLLDSKDDIESYVEAARKNPKKAQEMNSVAKKIQELRKKGIKVSFKKSKKRKNKELDISSKKKHKEFKFHAGVYVD